MMMTCTLTYKILIPLFNAGCNVMFKNQIFRMKWEECYLTTFYILKWCHSPGFALSMKQTQAFSLAFTILPHLHYEVKKKGSPQRQYRQWLFHSHTGSFCFVKLLLHSQLVTSFSRMPHCPMWLLELQPSGPYSREEARSKRPPSCSPSYKGSFL